VSATRTIAQLEEHQIDDYFRFRRRVFPPGPKQADRARWEWWFRDNPRVPGRAILTRVIVDDQEIVGALSAVPQALQVLGSLVSAVSWNDYFVDETRQLGLLALRLYLAGRDQYAVNIGANFSEPARRLFTKLGYVDLSAELRRVTAYFPANLGHSVPLTSHLKQSSLRPWRRILASTRYRVAVSDTIPVGTQELWATIAPGRPISFVKDANYLEWRYQQCPTVNYRFVHLDARGRTAALAVVAIPARDSAGGVADHQTPREGLIMDLLAPAGDSRTTCAAIKACLDFFESNGCGYCSTHLLDQTMLRHFVRMGFESGPSDLGFLVHTTQNRFCGAESVTRPERWSFWLGDTDRY
jgi:hypothetical protein